MTIFKSDEAGELTQVDSAVSNAVSLTQMQSGELGATFAKMFLTLIALCLLLFASYWFIRRLIQHRLQKGVGKNSIQVLEKKMISPKTMLYLVEVENKKILLAESQLEIKRLEGFELPKKSHSEH